MYYRIISLLGRGAGLFTRYAVSRLGTKRFLAETAGFVAYAEIVDAAAEHSDWVKKNQDALLALSLLPMGAFALKGAGRVGLSSLASRATLFANVSLVNSGRALAKYFSNNRAKVWRDGCEIAFNQGRDFVRLVATTKGLSYSHSGSKAGAALLASGFGGWVLSKGPESIDWDATATQLSLSLADIQLTEDEAKIEQLLAEQDPIALFEIGPRLVRNFCDECPDYPRDHAIHKLSQSLSNSEVKFGQFTLDLWVDNDGDTIFTLNGADFVRDDTWAENQGVMVLANPSGRTTVEPPQRDQELFQAICNQLDVIRVAGAVDFAPIPKTSRSMSQPIVVGAYAIAMLWDEATKELTMVYGEDGALSSAKDGLIDEHESTLLEEAEFDVGPWIPSWSMGSYTPGAQVPDAALTLSSVQSVAAGDLANQLGKSMNME